MKTAVLILAAGAASRFGSLKQLALIDGKPMLQHCIDTANSLFPKAVYTVLGNQSQQVIDGISGTHVIINPQWQRGLGSSIAAGIAYLQDHFDAILILLADQPRIKRHHLEQLIGLFKGEQVACSQYNSHLGVPAMFANPYFTALSELTGDNGGKVLLESICPAPKSLVLGNVAADIDYPQDLAAFIQRIEDYRT
jgi:molybdenum cofactor cytidylyltransferase